MNHHKYSTFKIYNIMKTNYTLGLLFLTVLSFGQAPTVAWTYDLPYYSTNLSIAVADDGTVYLGTDGKSSEPTRGAHNIFAIKNGALGGKILGAGAGGFLLLYISPENQKKLSKKLKKYPIIPFRFSKEGSKIIKI